MMKIIQRIVNNTKEKLIYNRFLLIKVGCMLIVALLSAGISTESVQAATGLKVYNYTTKKTSTYTGKQVKTTLNGTTIGDTTTPGILVDGVALLPYNDIFEISEIDATCIYNKEKGTISISKFGTTIQMTIGSKKAIVNGKTVTMSVAPLKLKYIKEDLIKILVPSRFITETLGLGYTWNSGKSTVAIVKNTMQLAYNGGKKFDYTGVQGLVTIDNKKVNLGNMPSVITNNTAMLRAKTVFANSVIGASYEYNKTNKTVTLTKDDIVLQMTIGSTTAQLNGKPMKLDTAPIIVTNYNVDTSYVMVPGGFTAACLGYDYTWNNSKKTSMISSHKADSPTTGGSNTDPELGDNGVIIEPGTILGQWSGNNTLYGKSSEVHELNSGATASTVPGSIYSVSRDYSNVKLNSETFMITGTTPFGKLTANSSDKTITIKAFDMSTSDQTYQMFGTASNYINTIGTYNNTEDKSSTIKLELMQSDYSYDISLSSDNNILYITVYQNALTSAVIGTNAAGDYITMTGVTPLKVTVSEQAGMIIIDLPYTTNVFGELNTNIIGSRYIKSLYTLSLADKTQIILSLNTGYQYYISENGNQFTVSLQTPGIVQPPTQEPNTPGGIDKSKYDIVIPKPEGITGSMISEEDYYYNNRIAIKLPGDYTDFFNNHAISHSSSVIDRISTSLNNNYETEILISTSRLQGFEIAVDNDNIYVNIGEPRDIYKNIVVLDPGHGGGACGAQYFNTKEKDINFKILYTIGKNYFNQDPSTLKVYYTRISDVDMSLSDRAGFAAKYDADLFVSLHMNASTASSAYGTEVYYASNNKAELSGLDSKDLATLFVNSITNALGTNYRGAKAERYTVVYKNTVPAVLIELGFLSNKNDHAKITDETFQNNAARTIYETILEVFEEYPTGR
jgi:N-acetylmuramoyl-L-alanine amidase